MFEIDGEISWGGMWILVGGVALDGVVLVVGLGLRWEGEEVLGDLKSVVGLR